MHKELGRVAKNISLLYVEDEKDTREQYEHIFELLFKEVKSVENGVEALEEYNRKKYDLVITDLTMPKMNGVDMIGEMLKIKPEQHIVIMTAHNTSENLRNTIEFQVDGILLKPVAMDKLFQLLYKICHLIDVDKKELDNNNLAQHNINDMIEDTNQAFFLVVVDRFDDIIKHFGYETHKYIIETVKEHMSNFGVEEENILELHEDVIICGVDKHHIDNILEAVQAFSSNNNSLIVWFSKVKIYITLSYGIVLLKQQSNLKNLNDEFLRHVNSIISNIKSDEYSDLIVRMDVDIEEAKKNNALTWLGVTLDALKQDTILPFYQPVVDINTMQTVAYEVFARIKQGEKYILPEFFIDLSQKAGILEDISQSIFKQSFAKLSDTKYAFHINLTDAEWRNTAIKDYLVYLSKQYKIDYDRIILDIMDYDTLKPDSNVLKSLLELKKLGCKIALKGFASANINIELLSLLQPDYIKIKQLLLQKSMNDKNIENALKFLIDYAHNVNIKSILVGVESKELLEEGKKLCIDYAQGYFIKEPSDEL